MSILQGAFVMKTFNNKLEIGQPAMIINTRLPENRYLVGGVVTVEEFVSVGDDISKYYELSGGSTLNPNKHPGIVVVSGCKLTGKSANGSVSMIPGYALFGAKNLMPLPPLGEKEIQKEKELEFS
jgi:hypothetical protein